VPIGWAGAYYFNPVKERMWSAAQRCSISIHVAGVNLYYWDGKTIDVIEGMVHEIVL